MTVTPGSVCASIIPSQINTARNLRTLGSDHPHLLAIKRSDATSCPRRSFIGRLTIRLVRSFQAASDTNHSHASRRDSGLLSKNNSWSQMPRSTANTPRSLTAPSHSERPAPTTSCSASRNHCAPASCVHAGRVRTVRFGGQRRRWYRQSCDQENQGTPSAHPASEAGQVSYEVGHSGVDPVSTSNKLAGRGARLDHNERPRRESRRLAINCFLGELLV
jgi:hypothetical protein